MSNSTSGTSTPSSAIESLSEETRRFAPPKEFADNAVARPGIYEEAERDYTEFWASWARKLEWMKPFTSVLEWKEPFATWFADGELNVSVNCLDRHVRAGKGDKVAYYFEGERGDRRAITYQELLDDVCRFANGLRSLGIKNVFVIDPTRDGAEFENLIQSCLAKPELSLVIARRNCLLAAGAIRALEISEQARCDGEQAD